MKKLILILLFIPIVSAFYGGESETIYTINDCFSHSYINVSAEKNITNGEYKLLNCNILKYDNFWKCPCTGTYNLIMETNEETFNNYTITIDYIYSNINANSGGGNTTYKSSKIISSIADLSEGDIEKDFQIITDYGNNSLINNTQDLNKTEHLRNKDTIKINVEDIRPIKQREQRIVLLVLLGIFIILLIGIAGFYIIMR